MKGDYYQNTFAAKGSALHEALVENKGKEAHKIYRDTTDRFDAIYPKGDRQWFEAQTNRHKHMEELLCLDTTNQCQEILHLKVMIP